MSFNANRPGYTPGTEPDYGSAKWQGEFSVGPRTEQDGTTRRRLPGAVFGVIVGPLNRETGTGKALGPQGG